MPPGRRPDGHWTERTGGRTGGEFHARTMPGTLGMRGYKHGPVMQAVKLASFSGTLTPLIA